MEVEGLGRFTDEATFQGGSRLDITLNGTTPGTEHSQLNGDDTIFLGGTLRILLEPGYTPDANDSFTVLTAPSVVGQFASVQGPDIAGTLLSFDVDYNPNSVVLVARGRAGAVPDGQNVPGVPLTVEHAIGDDITLQWGDSCFGDRDYEIYEGVLGGDFTSHSFLFCTTDANTSKTFTPSGGDRYYLGVPTTGHREGSYGVGSDLNQRPPGVRACYPQAFVVCGPI